MNQMPTSLNGINLIKQFEGLRLRAYKCPSGYLTIGYGHVLSSAHKTQTITSLQADELFHQDLARTEAALRRLIHVPLTQNQFDALVSFTFNLGAGALQRSTLRRKVNDLCHEDIPGELMRWVYAGGRRLSGLVRRRSIEGLLYGHQ